MIDAKALFGGFRPAWTEVPQRLFPVPCRASPGRAIPLFRKILLTRGLYTCQNQGRMT